MTIRRFFDHRACRSHVKASAIVFFSLLPAWSVQIAHAEETAQEPSYEEVVVRAHPLSAEGLAQSTISLTGDALARNLAPSLGELLSKQPGIHSSSFGAAVGRPVIHGLAGPRCYRQ